MCILHEPHKTPRESPAVVTLFCCSAGICQCLHTAGRYFTGQFAVEMQAENQDGLQQQQQQQQLDIELNQNRPDSFFLMLLTVRRI